MPGKEKFKTKFRKKTKTFCLWRKVLLNVMLLDLRIKTWNFVWMTKFII